MESEGKNKKATQRVSNIIKHMELEKTIGMVE